MNRTDAVYVTHSLIKRTVLTPGPFADHEAGARGSPALVGTARQPGFA
jgi:hypothetical protein